MGNEVTLQNLQNISTALQREEDIRKSSLVLRRDSTVKHILLA